MNLRKLHAIFFLSALLLTHSLLANDWPQFRGPDGQGHAEVRTLPTTWSPVNNVVWKTEIRGGGWSSPIIYRDKIYLTTAVEKEGSSELSLGVLCLDTHSGKIFWN